MDAADKKRNTKDNKKHHPPRENRDLQGTIRKLRQEIRELEAEKYMFHGLLDTIPDNIYFKNRMSEFLTVSKFGISKFGAKKLDEILGKTDFDIFTSEHAQDAYDDEQKIMTTGVPLINKEEKETWEDGSITWVSTSKVPLYDAKKRITGIVGISRDITEKKKTEEKLRNYRENLEKAKQETDNILRNVEEGLFLINRELNIASQHSAELKNMLEERTIANKNIIDVLRNKISDKNLDLTRRYLDLLFDDKHDETMLSPMNPLIEVELQNQDKKKYLTFRFRRIKNKSNRTSELIATVSDVTKEVILARSLAEQKADSQRRMDWLLSILNIDPTMLKEFITCVHEEMEQVDTALHAMVKSANQKNILEGVYRSIHTIKGNASLLQLDFFAEQAHHVENTIEMLRTKTRITAEDISSLDIQAKDIYKTYDELNGLIEHISNIQYQFRPKRSYEHQLLIQSLNGLIDRLAEKYYKKVKFEHKSFAGDTVPYHHRLLIRDILVQLVRNSLLHGIEVPAVRAALQKAKMGKISIAGKSAKNMYHLIYEDDGRGLDLNHLKQKALASGKWSQTEISRWQDKEVIETIFHQGISTAETTDETGGRGVGMNIIKQKLDKIGGTIQIETKANAFTRFIINIPGDKGASSK
jgi:two-component system chemotaxis sensor kinase CheA